MRGVPAGAEHLIQITLLGEAIEYMPVAVFVFDDEGRYIAVNAHASTMLGYTREELLSQRLGDLAESAREAFSAYRAVAEGREAEGRTRVLRKDGRPLDVVFRGAETTIAGIPFYVAVAWEPA
jgi:PAS domain S-box-containing protein